MAERGAAPAMLLVSVGKVAPTHLQRDAYVYIRQSTPSQVVQHTESLARQYELRERAQALGWPAHQVVPIDADPGRSGAEAAGRLGFRELVADVGPTASPDSTGSANTTQTSPTKCASASSFAPPATSRAASPARSGCC